MKELTEQQATILTWAQRGYPAGEIAKIIDRTPAQVADQIRLIRKKGWAARLVSASEARAVNRAEADRIVTEAKR